MANWGGVVLLVWCVVAAHADTLTHYVPLDGNVPYQCPLGCMTPDPTNYTCSTDRYWSSGKATFRDPLPPGSVISTLSLEIQGSYHCKDSILRTVQVAFYLNEHRMTYDATHTGGGGCDCGGCDGPLYSSGNRISSSEYNYQSTNSIEVKLNGDSVCFGGYQLSYVYEGPSEQPSPFACCIYVESTKGATDISCIQTSTSTCHPEVNRTLVHTEYVDSCETCFFGAGMP